MKRLLPWLGPGLALLAMEAEAQVSCSYATSPVLDFGSTVGLPTPQIDVTATVSVTCSSLISVNHRVCLSISQGSGGISIDDRRMAAGSRFVQYQLYSNASRTSVWGEMGGSSPPHSVDFPLLIGQRTVQVPIYGRVFSGQVGKAVATYQSDLTIIARRQDYVLFAPSCQNVSGGTSTLPNLPVRFDVATSCGVSASPLSFGTVSSIGGNTATSNLSVTCTLDGAYSIALDGGEVSGDVDARRMRLNTGPSTIDYQLYRDAAHTLPWGNLPGTTAGGTGSGLPQSIPVFGLIPPQAPGPPGTYQDVITVTVTF